MGPWGSDGGPGPRVHGKGHSLVPGDPMVNRPLGARTPLGPQGPFLIFKSHLELIFYRFLFWGAMGMKYEI